MPARVNTVYRISVAIQILMDRQRDFRIPFDCVRSPEPPESRVIVSGAQVIEAQIGIELFATVEKGSLGLGVRADEAAVRVKCESVYNRACSVREKSRRTVAVGKQ